MATSAAAGKGRLGPQPQRQDRRREIAAAADAAAIAAVAAAAAEIRIWRLGVFGGERGGTLRRWPPELAAAARCHHRSLGLGEQV